MRGHVAKRGTTWTYWVELPPGPDGRRRQKTKGGFRTKKLAGDAANEVIGALLNGTYVEPTRVTVGQFLIEQWEPAIRATIRPSTFASYDMHVRKYLVPRLGGIALQKLTPPAINALYGELLRPADDARGLSAASVRRVHATLHKALRDALRWQLVARNAASAADPPRARRPEMHVWTADQLRAFLDGVSDSSLAALWTFYALTGVRRGEGLGLRWADVDLDGRRAAIRQTVIPLRTGIAFSEPKTDKGRRSIALDDDTVVVLRRHRRAQLEDRLAVGVGYHDLDLVFARPDGSPLNPEWISRTFTRLARQLGLPPIRLHDLRHTHATLALVAGVATRVVGDRLGHSALAVTADTYQHVTLDLEEDAASRVARLVFGEPAEPSLASR